MIMPKSTNTTYALSRELIAANEVVLAAKQKTAKLRQRVDEAAANIKALKPEIGGMTNQLAEMEAVRALADDDQVKGMDADIKKFAEALDSKIRDLNRATNMIQTLEAKAPELDAAVDEAKNLLRMERSIWAEPILLSLRDELEEACRPLRGVLAKAKALQQCSDSLRDLLIAAWVPDPLNFMISHNGSYSYNNGRNILDAGPELEETAEADEIAIALLPINRQISEHHPEYVSLARRQPYVRAGVEYETSSPVSNAVRFR